MDDKALLLKLNLSATARGGVDRNSFSTKIRFLANALHLSAALGKLDTSLKRHSSLLARFRTTLHIQSSLAGLLKDILALSLEKYIEEAVGAVIEGLAKCKSGPEVAGAVQVSFPLSPSQSDSLINLPQIISVLHQRFPDLFTPPFTALLLQSLKPGSSIATDKEVKEREDNARIVRQRGFLRVLGELEIVGVVRKDQGNGMTGEVSYGVLRDLVRSLFLHSQGCTDTTS